MLSPMRRIFACLITIYKLIFDSRIIKFSKIDEEKFFDVPYSKVKVTYFQETNSVDKHIKNAAFRWISWNA